MTIEHRMSPATFDKIEGRTLSAYAILWNVTARIGDEFEEQWERGAFTRTLSDRTGMRDLVMLADHSPRDYLGRVANDTMRLSEDARGLLVEVDLPETTLGDDILALARRSDLGGLSVGFSVSPGGDSFAGNRRTIREANLYEVSVIKTHAAFPETSETISVRSIHEGAAADIRRRLYSFYLSGA